MGMSTSTIRQHKQFLKNYNMIQQIRHRYNINTVLQMKCLCSKWSVCASWNNIINDKSSMPSQQWATEFALRLVELTVFHLILWIRSWTSCNTWPIRDKWGPVEVKDFMTVALSLSMASKFQSTYVFDESEHSYSLINHYVPYNYYKEKKIVVISYLFLKNFMFFSNIKVI